MIRNFKTAGKYNLNESDPNPPQLGGVAEKNVTVDAQKKSTVFEYNRLKSVDAILFFFE